MTEETKKEENNIETEVKKEIPDIKPGDTVKVYQKITDVRDDKIKERIQVFEGIVLAKKHGKGISATITVRKVIDGVGVERIFPLHSPFIEKIEIVRSSKVRRAKLYYLREAKGKKAKLKMKEGGSQGE
jgi:large subunit ribosomal protein L19